MSQVSKALKFFIIPKISVWVPNWFSKISESKCCSQYTFKCLEIETWYCGSLFALLMQMLKADESTKYEFQMRFDLMQDGQPFGIFTISLTA